MEKIPGNIIVRVTEEYHIGQAQWETRYLAGSIGLGRIPAYSAATAASELACNLFFHAARGGKITLTAIRRDGKTGIEIMAEDSGPGISDMELALRDGFSTNGGLGGGLPGVKRLMDEFEITSEIGAGTRIITRKWQPCG